MGIIEYSRVEYILPCKINFNNIIINTRVLKTAIREINETSEKQIKVEHVKENKKVVALKLIIKNKDIIETFVLNRQYER